MSPALSMNTIPALANCAVLLVSLLSLLVYTDDFLMDIKPSDKTITIVKRLVARATGSMERLGTKETSPRSDLGSKRTVLWESVSKDGP